MSDEFCFYFDCVGFWGLGFFNSLDSVDEHIISYPGAMQEMNLYLRANANNLLFSITYI